MNIRPIILALAVLALSFGPAAAQSVRTSFTPDTVSVGDRFHFSLTLERPEASVAIFPDPARGDTVLGDLEILDRSIAVEPVRGSGGQLVRDSVTYVVTTFALDSAMVPPQEILLIAGADTSVVATPTAQIPVRSLVPEDAGDVRDLAPIEDFPRRIWLWILLAALLLALAAALFYYFYRRRRRGPPETAAVSEPARPPYEEAVDRLKRLETYDLHRPQDVKPFYVELSDLLRTYLERRLAVPALESTTRELVDLLERPQMEDVPSPAVDRTRDILEKSDLVKFADAKPPPEEGYAAVADARRVVDQLEEAVRSAESATESTASSSVESPA